MYNFSKQVYDLRKTSIYKLPNIIIAMYNAENKGSIRPSVPIKHTQQHKIVKKQNAMKINITNDNKFYNYIHLSSGLLWLYTHMQNAHTFYYKTFTQMIKMIT